ncbi:hypothetical protein [Amycolatopsis viridis]|uniref:Helicase n=1 Tax=Amycolatopsis viridis TaxID=185678 RepID=A0ABX0SUW8_9PSEU|nr:hypothetical protein [Amycolatopsis viridis]NIH80763.1 putative helicase [Amycolatopsis viridis]
MAIGTVGFDGDGDGGSTNDAVGAAAGVQATLDLPVEIWRDAIYAKIVTKVGERAYWENWAKDVAVIAERHVARITALVDDPASGKRAAFAKFLDELRPNINPGVSKADAIDMLAQHLITKPVFDALFLIRLLDQEPGLGEVTGSMPVLPTAHFSCSDGLSTTIVGGPSAVARSRWECTAS